MPTLPLSAITADYSLQFRLRLNTDAVRDYAIAYQDGKTLPPLLCCRVPDGRLLLVDGFHRLEALRRLHCRNCAVIIEEGTIAHARARARQANRGNGLRLTRADKANMVRETIKEYPDWTDYAIAKECGVNHKTVKAVRRGRTMGIPIVPTAPDYGNSHSGDSSTTPYRPCVCCELSQDAHERLAEILTLGLDPVVVAESLRSLLHILDAETTQ